MRTYLLYIVGLVALTVVLAVSIQSRLLWPIDANTLTNNKDLKQTAGY